MIEHALDSPIIYAVVGGAGFGAVFASKAYIDGERIDGIKFGLTVLLAALLGAGFEVAGYQPDPSMWYLVLAEFAGMVALTEAALKALVRGHYQEARARAGEAVDEGTRATGRLAEHAGPGRVDDEVARRTPDSHGPREEDDHDAAVDEALEDAETDDWIPLDATNNDR